MNNQEEKIIRMKKHLLKHPTDYQTKISLFKNVSDNYKYEQKRKKDMKFKKLAEVKR